MKSLKLLLSVIGLFFIVANSSAQNRDFKSLTQEDYYRDFDTLQKWITTVSPIYLVNDKLKGQSYLNEMKKLRNQLKSVHSNENFLKIVYKALNLIQDPHASLLTSRDNVGALILYPQKDTSYISESCNFYDSIYNKTISTVNMKLRLPIKYSAGRYLVYYPFKLGGVLIDTGYTVQTVNGRNINEVVKGKIPEIPILKYDFTKNLSYYDNFYKIKTFYSNPDSMMQIGFVKNKKQLKIKFRVSDTAIIDQSITFINFNRTDNFKKVIYIDSLDILYIRMPQMADGNFYVQEVKKYLNKKPSKIVFDIRGNGGGQDYVYASSLKLLIKENEVAIPFYFGLRNNDFVKNGMRKWLHESVFGMQQTVFTSPLIPDKEFYTFKVDADNYYTPDSLSMRFNGNIYILCHGYEYSSAGNFVDIAKSNAKIISVGMNTGLFGGTEFSPLPFILPNSKIIFRLAPNIDFKNVNTIADFYHNQIEVSCIYSLTDLYNIAVNKGDISDIEFLLHRDPLFSKVRELK